MLKKNLREVYKAKRKQLTAEQISVKSKQIAERFVQNFLLEKYLNVHIFLPIENKVEINTWEIINNIFSFHPSHRIIVSKSNLHTCKMSHFVLTKDTSLRLNAWNIPEPEQGDQLGTAEINQVLIPLLCFDRLGNRVGYGKGFYDRFLTECNASVQKIGLSFFEPSEIVEDASAEDIKLDFCITPNSIYCF